MIDLPGDFSGSALIHVQFFLNGGRVRGLLVVQDLGFLFLFPAAAIDQAPDNTEGTGSGNGQDDSPFCFLFHEKPPPNLRFELIYFSLQVSSSV